VWHGSTLPSFRNNFAYAKLGTNVLSWILHATVIIDKQSNLVSLVHPTTQEKFEVRRAEFFPTAHDDIAASCITYLRMKPFRDEGALDDFDAFYRRCCSSHLLGYAVVNCLS